MASSMFPETHGLSIELLDSLFTQSTRPTDFIMTHNRNILAIENQLLSNQSNINNLIQTIQFVQNIHNHQLRHQLVKIQTKYQAYVNLIAEFTNKRREYFLKMMDIITNKQKLLKQISKTNVREFYNPHKSWVSGGIKNRENIAVLRSFLELSLNYTRYRDSRSILNQRLNALYKAVGDLQTSIMKALQNFVQSRVTVDFNKIKSNNEMLMDKLVLHENELYSNEKDLFKIEKQYRDAFGLENDYVTMLAPYIGRVNNLFLASTAGGGKLDLGGGDAEAVLSSSAIIPDLRAGDVYSMAGLLQHKLAGCTYALNQKGSVVNASLPDLITNIINNSDINNKMSQLVDIINEGQLSLSMEVFKQALPQIDAIYKNDVAQGAPTAATAATAARNAQRKVYIMLVQVHFLLLHYTFDAYNTMSQSYRVSKPMINSVTMNDVFPTRAATNTNFTFAGGAVQKTETPIPPQMGERDFVNKDENILTGDKIDNGPGLEQYFANLNKLHKQEFERRYPNVSYQSGGGRRIKKQTRKYKSQKGGAARNIPDNLNNVPGGQMNALLNASQYKKLFHDRNNNQDIPATYFPTEPTSLWNTMPDDGQSIPNHLKHNTFYFRPVIRTKTLRVVTNSLLGSIKGISKEILDEPSPSGRLRPPGSPPGGGIEMTLESNFFEQIRTEAPITPVNAGEYTDYLLQLVPKVCGTLDVLWKYHDQMMGNVSKIGKLSSHLQRQNVLDNIQKAARLYIIYENEKPLKAVSKLLQEQTVSQLNNKVQSRLLNMAVHDTSRLWAAEDHKA